MEPRGGPGSHRGQARDRTRNRAANRGRSADDPPPEVHAGPELTDLGEHPLPRTFAQAPERVDHSSRVRRLSMPAVVVGAIAVITLGVAGSAVLVAGPGPSPTPGGTPASSDSAAASPSPTSDPCATTLAGQPVPVVTLTRTGQFGQRRPVALTVADPVAAGFEPPVDRTVEVPAGAAMRLELSDPRCVSVVRLDLHGTGVPGDDALAISVSAPLSDGRSFAFSAPPSGDWILRVALSARAPAELAGKWAIYYFRLNAGYVAYVEPLPSGFQGGADGPIETPAIPCGSPPIGWPLAVELATPDGSVQSGLPLLSVPVAWEDDALRTTLPATLQTATPIELALDQAIDLRVSGAACAVRWQLEAGPIPPAGQHFEAAWWWAGQSDNDTRDPAVISQNIIEAHVASVGEYALRLLLDLPDIGAEAMFWRVRVAGPDLPIARIVGPDGTAVTMSRRCGAAYELQSGTFASDACPTTWPLLDDGPVLDVPAGSLMRVDASGATIVRWWAQYADRATVAEAVGLLDGASHLADGGSELGFASVEVPAPPLDPSPPGPSGEAPFGWLVEINVSVRIADGIAQVPYFVRIRVTGGCCD